MILSNHSAQKSSLALLNPALVIAALLAISVVNSEAQSGGNPLSSSTPLGLAPGAPAGSYALSGFDNVNLFNGNLNFALPLLQVGGRGAARYTMTLPIEQK